MSGNGTRTVERLNLGKQLLPPLVLLVHRAEVGDEEGLLSVRLSVGAQVESVHDPVSEVDVRVPAVQGRQPRDRDLVIVVALGVLEVVGVFVRVYSSGRRK